MGIKVIAPFHGAFHANAKNFLTKNMPLSDLVFVLIVCTFFHCPLDTMNLQLLKLLSIFQKHTYFLVLGGYGFIPVTIGR